MVKRRVQRIRTQLRPISARNHTVITPRADKTEMGDPRRKCELSKEIIVCLVVRKIISLTVYCTTLRTAFVTCLAATVHDSYEYLLPAEQTVGIHLDIF